MTTGSFVCHNQLMKSPMSPDPPSDSEIEMLFEQQLGIPARQIEHLRGGAWSSVAAVIADHHQYVIRFSKVADDFYRDAFAAKFNSPHLPIPQVHGVGQLGERWWCISDRVPGSHLDNLDEAGMRRLLPSLASMFSEMRRVNNQSTHGFGNWDIAGNGTFTSFGEQLLDVSVDVPGTRSSGWTQNLKEYKQESQIFDHGCEKLRDLVPFLSSDRHLIHMDTINFNVNVEGDAISGIYDWGCAMWGDSVYDLAWFSFWEPWYPQWSQFSVSQSLINSIGIVGEHADLRLACCELHIGLSHIRYNAFIDRPDDLNEVAQATQRLLETLE